ncbi:hypothetical protein U27_05056 [Candidatus Vecturithrix granuli]|uniref:Uncharacterized protein n=1 Tax=Vecturithrix granuli TaxID=1499967 RepID=A0A081C0H8_VECG1|nr:hypothetical protein U27_05056 [Candidatus Vecturithrix granuli]
MNEQEIPERNRNIEVIKKHHRKNLAALPFDLKIAMLINMQKIAREMALAAGRPFKGTVWCEQPHRQPTKKHEVE